jgi:cytochrome c5
VVSCAFSPKAKPAGTLLAARAFAAEPSGVEFFEQRVRPVLAEHCDECHGETKQKGALRLDSRAGWAKGGESGPAQTFSRAE